MKTRIPIKRYVDDETLSWEERYKRLMTHHEEEAKFLIGRIEELETEVAEIQSVWDLTWKADQKAIEIWRTSHPRDETVFPDRSKMTEWMLERITALKAALLKFGKHKNVTQELPGKGGVTHVMDGPCPANRGGTCICGLDAAWRGE